MPAPLGRTLRHLTKSGLEIVANGIFKRRLPCRDADQFPLHHKSSVVDRAPEQSSKVIYDYPEAQPERRSLAITTRLLLVTVVHVETA